MHTALDASPSPSKQQQQQSQKRFFNSVSKQHEFCLVNPDHPADVGVIRSNSSSCRVLLQCMTSLTTTTQTPSSALSSSPLPAHLLDTSSNFLTLTLDDTIENKRAPALESKQLHDAVSASRSSGGASDAKSGEQKKQKKKKKLAVVAAINYSTSMTWQFRQPSKSARAELATTSGDTIIVIGDRRKCLQSSGKHG
jgi:hypothetical protein